MDCAKSLIRCGVVQDAVAASKKPTLCSDKIVGDG